MSVNKKVLILGSLIVLIAFIGNLNFYNKLISRGEELDSAILQPATPLQSMHVPILIYHYIEYVQDERDTIRKALNIMPFTFIKQIETLKNAGYTFITASELIDILDGKIKQPQKPVLISFDDGYRDFYTDVFPILKKYNVKAVAYIVSGFLDKPNYMFTWQLQEIAKSGLVEIGGHTVNHASLEGFDYQFVKYEVEESKKELEKLINTPIVSFAYPNGSFDNQAIKIVKEAGFKSGVTTIHGYEINQNNKFSLYRIHPGNKTDNFLLDYLEQK